MRRALVGRLGAVTLGMVALVGCSTPTGDDPASGPAAETVTVSSCGRDVTVEQRPQRVLTHREQSTVVAAAGGSERIVARAGEASVPLGQWAEELALTPQIAENEMEAPSREVILGEEADLVVAGRVQDDYVANLEQVGVDVVVPPWFCNRADEAGNAGVGFDDLYTTIGEYGRVLGTEDAAARTVEDLRDRVTAVEQQAGAAAAPPRTVVNAWLGRDGVTSVYGAYSVNHTIMNTLGLTNRFGDLQARNPRVGFETILGRDPDLVVVSYLPSNGYASDADAVAAFARTPGADQLRAVREGNVIAINSAYIAGGPLSVDGLEMLADALTAPS